MSLNLMWWTVKSKSWHRSKLEIGILDVKIKWFLEIQVQRKVGSRGKQLYNKMKIMKNKKIEKNDEFAA